MKYCQNCGIKLDDNANFCIECGGTAADNSGGAPSDYSSVSLLSANSVMDTVRDRAKSTLFLATLIVFTVMLSLTFMISLYNAVVTPTVRITIGGMVSFSASRVASLVTAVVGTAPNALILTGLWMTYRSANNDEQISTSGLSLIRVMLVILLVLLCVAFPIIILGLVLFLVGMDSISNQDLQYIFGSFFDGPVIRDDLSVLLITIIIILVIVAVFAIIYYAKAIGTVKSIKATIETNTVMGKISGFVAILAIIGGVFFALGTLISITESSLITLICDLSRAASFILFGSVLGNFKTRIEALK
ncbi:MAG: zinc ribbon domain-containing protein [Clostridia bacterium]|nr:zinc ribbon domain-containing protein [Clostridia bacterium]